MSNTDIITCGPHNIEYFIKRTLQAGRVPMVEGSPGIGKSSIMRGIAKDLSFLLIDDRVATRGPEHYAGLPDVSGDKAIYKPFSIFPLAHDKVPDGYNGWLFFMDEINGGLPSTLIGAYRFLLEREVAEHKLHPSCLIAAAGNGDDDRAITNDMGTALKSRLVWFKYEVNGNNPKHFEHYMQNVMIPNNWHPAIIGFLSYKKHLLNNFNPESEEKTFACPRTWEFLSDLIKTDPTLNPADMPLYAGAIGVTAASEFLAFVRLLDNLPTVKEILADPLTAPIPDDSARRYAVSAMLVGEAGEKNITDIALYMGRFSNEFQIMFWRSFNRRNPGLQQHPAVRQSSIHIARYLYG